MSRLPISGSDQGTWGDILNDYLSQAHDSDGTLKTSSVTASQIKSGAITTAAIADNTITPAKLTNAGQAGGPVLLNSSAQLDDATLPDRLSEGSLNATYASIDLLTSKADLMNGVVPISQIPTLSKDDIGLDQVDNISDLNKPVSIATQTALDNLPVGTNGDTTSTTATSANGPIYAITPGSFPSTLIITVTGDIAFVFSGTFTATKSGTITLILTQDAIGGHTVTLPTGTRWAEGIIPTVPAGANALSIYQLFWTGHTVWVGFVGGTNFA